MAAAVGAVAALAVGGYLFAHQRRQGSGMAKHFVEFVELDVPVSTAYNQWTQFEEFPKFMATVQSVEQVDDTHLHWRALVGGKIKEWDAEITEQIPDQRIAWRSIGGVDNSGVVTFHKINDNRTRVTLQMDYSPQTIAEKAGDVVGAVKLTTKANLQKFKKLVESRGAETGAWRGTVTH
ncbi:SRPBCC family protein [Ramlibacter sp. HM2]|uniref:SRPBCC family protein n=2 Tax=Ramlibacter pallidus TaxID=2780087 RepID=A0ABR9RXK5_9BURK|nr:SRPBCC family protein [Ramlibacter pallidus]